MKLTKKLILVIAILLSSMLLITFFGCQDPLTDALADAAEEEEDGEPDPVASALAVDEAIIAMKDQRYEDALSWFSQAVIYDPNNGTAIIGYSMLNLADIATDPAMLTVFQDKLKIYSYPDSIDTLFNPDKFGSWTQEFGEDGGVFPYMTDLGGDPVEDLNDDETVNLEDYLIQLGFNYVASYNGIEPLTETLGSLLGGRLQEGIIYIKAANDEAYLNVTHDMLGISEENWPDNGEGPIEFKFGKAELLLVASGFEMLKMVVDIGQVWKLVLDEGVLEDYWNAFNPTISDPDPSGLTKPFATEFLTPYGDAGDKMLAAKTAFENALIDAEAGINMILLDRDGFTISSDTNGIFNGDYSFTDWSEDAQIGLDGGAAALDSLQDLEVDQLFYVPIPDYDISLGWPEEDPAPGIDDGVVAVNLGAFFSESPIGLVSMLLDLDPTTTEPNFYSYGEGFSPVNNISFFSYAEDDGGSYNFTEDETVLYFKIKDVTFGGFFDIDNFDFTDPETILEGNELYIGIPAWVAWFSFADDGTTGLDEYGDPIESFGSIYWAWLNEFDSGPIED